MYVSILEGEDRVKGEEKGEKGQKRETGYKGWNRKEEGHQK
jgi:hypothetical protein